MNNQPQAQDALIQAPASQAQLALVEHDKLGSVTLLAALIGTLDANAAAQSIAAAALARYGSLKAVLALPAKDLVRELELKVELAEALAAVYQAMLFILQEPLKQRQLIPNARALEDYARFVCRHEVVESLHVLFLDKRNALIADIASRGSIDHVPFYPREITKKALELGAFGVIILHNHPSGTCDPSRADILMTRRLQRALEALDLILHDHIIFADDAIVSLRARGDLC